MKPKENLGFTLIDWEFCYENPFDKKLLKKLGDTTNDPNNNKKAFYSKLINSKECEHVFNAEKYLIADQYIMFVALYPELITEYLIIKFDSIVYDGEKQGMTTFFENNNSSIILVNKINTELFKKITLESVEL